MAGKLRTKQLRASEQYQKIDDLKVRLSLIALSERYNEQIRELIARAYTDPGIHAIWNGIRASGVYDKGGKSKVHRKILEFPNAYVFDFVDTVMTAMHGQDWLKKPQALRHELVRPWWVVSKL